MTPTLIIFWLVFGIALASLFILLAKQGSYDRYLQTMGIGLIIAALIYIGFAAVWGDLQWLFFESLGALIYTSIALVGLRKRSAKVLAVGWMSHVIWDIALHLFGPGNHVAPEWYALACLSFDLLAAAHLFSYKPREILL